MITVKFKYKYFWKWFSPKWRMIRKDTERFMNDWERKFPVKKKHKKVIDKSFTVRI